MCFVRHPHEGREFFALSARGDHHDLVGRILAHILNRHDVFNFYQTKMLDNLNVSPHAPALNNHFLAIPSSNVEEFDDALYLRSKGGNDHSSWHVGNYLVNVFKYRSF